MADDPPTHHQPAAPSTTLPASDTQVQLEAKVEDAETRAAREELKHTVISDHKPQDQALDDDNMRLRSGTAYNEAPATAAAVERAMTPDLRPEFDSKKPASPGKKKRAHAEVGEEEESNNADGTRTARTSSGADSDSWVVVDDATADEKRPHRSEPQKKRARDETSPPADLHKGTGATATSIDSSATTEAATPAPQPQTSAKAFAASGFSKLADSSASPFAAAAGAGKSVFGGAASSASPFAALGGGSASPSKPIANTPSLSKPTLAFGGAEGAPSPFARMNGSAAPSAFGGGGFGGGSPFGSALGGSRISNFASAAAPPLKSDKPAKPFGAPDSDAEDDEEEDGSDSEGEGSAADAEKKEDKEEASASRADEPTPVTGGDDERKKYKKVFVDDGEAGEATLVQVRARMYYLDKSTSADGKQEIAWRERGAGMLKINVPVETVRLDRDSGAADPKSFDPASLADSTPEKPKMVRLLMRQDSTLRVILNTAMAANMGFQVRESLKTKSVLFTAVEGDEAKLVQVQMKMSPQSADVFLKAVDGVKKKMNGEES